MTATSIRRPVTLTALGGSVVLMLLGLVVGCGVPLDESPRAISRSTTPPEATPTTSGSPTADTVNVYFVDAEVLRPDAFPVNEAPTMETLLGFVLTGKPTPPLVNLIPPGTLLLDATIEDNTVYIDLSDEINAISGQPQKHAYAQITLTALQYPGVTRVKFQVDGEPVRPPTDNGNIEVVTAEDFASMLPG